MREDLIAVLDVGKTLAKLSLWSRDAVQIAKVVRPNSIIQTGSYRALDVDGMIAWIGASLRDFARLGSVRAIIPVGHGAAAVIVRNGQPCCPPLDYEQEIPADVKASYETERDPFTSTGSPSLPQGLNLGAQLYWLEQLYPDLWFGGSHLLLWPQYWAWVLSGIAASEVTSLGCHSDLWLPLENRPSALAERRDWARHLPPLRKAGEVLGPIRREWIERTGLPADTAIICGIHDSNAALIAARGFAEIDGKEATILSTGTWFVAMRTPAKGAALDISRLDPARDCLVNIDVLGQAIPSARFMGGREIELLTGIDSRRIDIQSDQSALIAALQHVVEEGVMILPGFAPGFGPYGGTAGAWIKKPPVGATQRAAIALYAAMVADAMLDLIGAREQILVEGRFGEADAFVRALASLRPDDRLYRSNAHNDVSYGALRLLDPALPPPGQLEIVHPLDIDLQDYKVRWREQAEKGRTME